MTSKNAWVFYKEYIDMCLVSDDFTWQI